MLADSLGRAVKNIGKGGAECRIASLLKYYVNQLSKDGVYLPQAPIHIAISHNDPEMVQILLDNGADINLKDGNKRTPLHLASKFGFLEMAEFLIGRHALLEHRDKNSQTPLMLAVMEGQLEMVKLLAKRGANMTVKNANGENLIFLALAPNDVHGKPEMFAYLLEMGLDPTQPCDFGLCALQETLMLPEFLPLILHRHLIERLMERCMPLQAGEYAYEADRLEALLDVVDKVRRYMSAEQVSSFLNIQPPGKISLLCRVAASDYESDIENVLKIGADIEHEGCDLGTALMAACAMGAFEAVKFLVRRGARLVYRSGDKTRSAVALAAPFPDIAKWLVADRFWSQGRLEFASMADAPPQEFRPRSGLGLGMVDLEGERRRIGEESSIDYAKRLCEIRSYSQGHVVRLFELPDASDAESLQNWTFVAHDI